MSETVVLDARPVSQIAHPRKFEDISDWFETVVTAGYRVVIPEIIDYEVRRGLLRIPATRRTVMHDAAHVWAEARVMGKPFTSDDRLDADAILIAQVRALGNLDAVTVITENIRHLKPFVPVMQWREFAV